jgi:hypothetical protein
MTNRSKRSAFWDAYRNMHRRCYDPEYHSYHRYGGRGIYVCLRWHEFDLFCEDLLDKWEPGLTLDRIDNDGPYSPSNVLIVSKSENSKPRRIDYKELMELRAQGVPYKKLAEHFGVSLSAVSAAAYKVRNGKTTL